MSYRSIGEGEQANLHFDYQPVQYTAPPVFPTYQVVMDALKNVLQPINDRFDPEKRMRAAQLAEYMSPQAAQLRQREMALREKNVGMQEEIMPSSIEAAKARSKLTTSQAAIMDQAAQGKHPSGMHFNGRIFVPDTPAQQGSDSVNSALDAAKAAHSKTRTQPSQAPVIGPVPNANSTQPPVYNPIVTPAITTPPATGSTGVPPNVVMNNDEQVALTPQGIVNPRLNVAPDIMTDEYQQA